VWLTTTCTCIWFDLSRVPTYSTHLREPPHVHEVVITHQCSPPIPSIPSIPSTPHTYYQVSYPWRKPPPKVHLFLFSLFPIRPHLETPFPTCYEKTQILVFILFLLPPPPFFIYLSIFLSSVQTGTATSSSPSLTHRPLWRIPRCDSGLLSWS
jgi:hypothetical protein